MNTFTGFSVAAWLLLIVSLFCQGQYARTLAHGYMTAGLLACCAAGALHLINVGLLLYRWRKAR